MKYSLHLSLKCSSPKSLDRVWGTKLGSKLINFTLDVSGEVTTLRFAKLFLSKDSNHIRKHHTSLRVSHTLILHEGRPAYALVPHMMPDTETPNMHARPGSSSFPSQSPPNLESNPTDSVGMAISDSSTNSGTGTAEMEIRADLVHKVFRILSLYRSIRDRLPIMKKSEILFQMAEEHNRVLLGEKIPVKHIVQEKVTQAVENYT